MPSTFFYLAATTVVFVGRRVFVGSFKACITLSMQHGRLNSAILFLAIARRSAFFFKVNDCVNCFDAEDGMGLQRLRAILVH